MAKEVHGRRTEDDDEDRKRQQERERNDQKQQEHTKAGPRVDPAGNPMPSEQPQNDPAYDQMMKEQQQQSEKAGKERQTYLDEMNRRIGEVVNFASQNKDSNPQLLNLTSEALKNAADQIDAATPQGVSRPQTQQGGTNPAPSMRAK